MENKIQTGLPYNMDMMDEIRLNGAIVDMNDIHFPNIEEDMMTKVSFIFLRNTDYPVIYDFSKCSYEKKSKYLISYLTDAVYYQFDELVQTWLAILCFSLGIVLENKGIFNEEELKCFVEEHLDFVGELLHLLISLPVYAVSRFENNGEKIDVSDIDINECKLFNDNIVHLLYNSALNIILESDTIFEPMNYIHYFTETNDKLFDALQELPYMALLVGLTEKTPSEWEDFLKDYNDVIREFN